MSSLPFCHGGGEAHSSNLWSRGGTHPPPGKSRYKGGKPFAGGLSSIEQVDREGAKGGEKANSGERRIGGGSLRTGRGSSIIRGDDRPME